MMSSLAENGISITLLQVDGPRRAEILEYIDLPVDSPNWPHLVNLETQVADVLELTQDPKAREIPKQDFAKKDDGPTQRFRTCIGSILDQVIANESSLNEWSNSVGDKDFGAGAISASKADMLDFP